MSRISGMSKQASTGTKDLLWMDLSGGILSTLCVLHCLLLPLVLTVFPMMGLRFLQDEWFHHVLLILVVPIALWSLGVGFRKHRKGRMLLLGGLGISCLVMAEVVGHRWGVESLMSIAGGLFLVSAHWLNYRACQTVCRNHSCHSHG